MRAAVRPLPLHGLAPALAPVLVQQQAAAAALARRPATSGRLPPRASAPLPRPQAARPSTVLLRLAAAAGPRPQSRASSSSRPVAAALARPARTRTSKKQRKYVASENQKKIKNLFQLSDYTYIRMKKLKPPRPQC